MGTIFVWLLTISTEMNGSLYLNCCRYPRWWLLEPLLLWMLCIMHYAGFWKRWKLGVYSDWARSGLSNFGDDFSKVRNSYSEWIVKATCIPRIERGVRSRVKIVRSGGRYSFQPAKNATPIHRLGFVGAQFSYCESLWGYQNLPLLPSPNN